MTTYESIVAETVWQTECHCSRWCMAFAVIMVIPAIAFAYFSIPLAIPFAFGSAIAYARALTAHIRLERLERWRR